MKRFLLLVLTASFTMPPVVSAGISKEAHNACKEVKDYKGCVESWSSGVVNYKSLIREYRDSFGHFFVNMNEVQSKVVEGKPKDSYWKFKMTQEYYRNGMSLPGYTSPYNATTTFFGNQAFTTFTGGQTVGAINIPSGYRTRVYKVEVDCSSRTTDIKGDGKGWLNYGEGSTGGLALITTVANEACPLSPQEINRLGKSKYNLAITSKEIKGKKVFKDFDFIGLNSTNHRAYISGCDSESEICSMDLLKPNSNRDYSGSRTSIRRDIHEIVRVDCFAKREGEEKYFNYPSRDSYNKWSTPERKEKILARRICSRFAN